MSHTHKQDSAGRSEAVDLEGYFARIGYAGPLEATLDVLHGLHFAHATGIPFENLDILLGRPISLELHDLEAKLVQGRRGGYCFEQNTLFAAVLEQAGFQVTRLAARVRMGATTICPRLHMMLSVELAGSPWLADVGFGGAGPLYPMPLLPSEPAAPPLWSHRIRAEGNVLVLQTLLADGWLDLYAFTLEVQYPVDYAVANHYTSTHSHSPFVTSLVVQRFAPLVRFTLRNRELTEERPDRKVAQTLPDDEALLTSLADVFGLHFPAGTRFRYRAAPSS